MKLNIMIAIAIGVLTYGLTLYFNHNDRPNMVVQPEDSALIKPVLGKIAPDFSFTDTKGRARALRDFGGKIVILNFWASWCAPCIKEFPALIELASTNKDVVLIALSSDFESSAMHKFIEKMKKNHPAIARSNIYIALDEDNRITGPLYETFKLPETLIIDRSQMLAHKLIGANWTVLGVQNILSDL